MVTRAPLHSRVDIFHHHFFNGPSIMLLGLRGKWAHCKITVENGPIARFLVHKAYHHGPSFGPSCRCMRMQLPLVCQLILFEN